MMALMLLATHIALSLQEQVRSRLLRNVSVGS